MDTVPGKFERKPVTHTIEQTRKKRDESDSEDEAPQQIDYNVPELKEWDPTTLPDHFFLVLEGKRRTGKSTFAKWLLQYYQNRFSIVWCMSNTKASGYWQEFVGDAFTFDSWYPSAVFRLIERNDRIIKQYGEDSPAAKRLGSALIILDDVISSRVHDDSMFLRLAVEGRHHLISVVLMTQDPKAINPKVRDNADVAVIFNQKTFRNKETIWADFLNDTRKEVGFGLLSKYAVEHNALVAIQTNLNSNISRSFFKSTGDKTKLKDPEYMLGGEQQKEIIKKERAERKIKKKKMAEDSQYAKEDTSEIKKFSTEILQSSGSHSFFPFIK